MFLLLRLALALVVAARACEAAALGVTGPEGEGGVAPEDLAVIRELEELNEKIHMAEKFTNPEHQPQARVVPLDNVPEKEEFGREEYYESSDDATEIPLVETTASSSSVAVNASVAADNEVTSPPLTTLPLTTLPLTSPPTGTTPADLTLLEAISTVLSTVASNTTSVLSSSSISASVTSNTTHVPSTSNISTVSAPPELGNDIDNAQPSTGQDITESNIINPSLPEEQRPPNNIAFGEFKVLQHISNIVGPADVDRLHSEPAGHHPPHDVPEQLSGGDFLCPDRYYRLGRTCYRTSDQQLSFFGATQDCRAENGDLAIIKDPPTHRFLIELIQQTYRSGDLHYWIGLSDMLREGTFVWSDGIPLEGTTFWASGQPNNIGAGQHCVYMYPSYDYKWVDGECSDQHYYICQQPAVNSLDQILYSHLFDIGISALGETPEGPHVAQPTPSD